MRIHTLTFNPAIDQTVTLDRLVPGEVHRARAATQNAGGKGVNVASCLADWGATVAAHGILGRDNAAPFKALLAHKAIEDRFVRVAGSTRVNLKLVDSAATTDINLEGIEVDDGLVEQVATAVCDAAQPGDLVVLAGSLPPGCPPDIYAELVRHLRGAGCQVLLDTSGEPLERALAADLLPNVIKPNRDELSVWAGHSLVDHAALIGTASELRHRGVELVVVSMGAEGALFVSAQGAFIAHLAADSVASTVGAGDAMVAGIAAALGEGLELEGLARLATAFAVGKLGMAGPNLPRQEEVRVLAKRVRVDEISIA